MAHELPWIIDEHYERLKGATMDWSQVESDHLAAQLRVCDAAMQVLTDKADFAASDAKAQANCEILDAVRERPIRIAQRLAAIDRASGSRNNPTVPEAGAREENPLWRRHVTVRLASADHHSGAVVEGM
jgi:hypothetical protein